LKSETSVSAAIELATLATALNALSIVLLATFERMPVSEMVLNPPAAWTSRRSASKAARIVSLSIRPGRTD